MTPPDSALARLGAAYMNLIEYFVPASVRADRDKANQARMFLISHSLGPILGNAVPLSVLAFNATLRIDAIVLVAAVTAFWIFPWLLRRGIRYDVLVLTSVVNLNFCILWSCYFYGGVSSPTLPWLLIIPILSLFYIGGERRLQPALLAISAGAFVLFLVMYSLVPPPPMNMPAFAVHGLGFVSTAAALAYVATMAIYYSRIFDASIALEAEVQRRRATADQLREAIVAADRAGSAKADFLARMSHEIKTPLNAIIGYSQLLREEALPQGEAARQDIDRIHSAGTYLLRLINMILDLSKLEAGKMRFDIRRQSLVRCLSATVAEYRASTGGPRNSIVLDVDGQLDEASFDSLRLKQVLTTIIENADQHTSRGTIAVVARPAMGSSGTFDIRIVDTGAGIPPETLGTLFENLHATREAAGGRFGGTGLSLTVAQLLCRAMGGGIAVESTVGLGSSFTVSLPIAGATVGPQK